MEETTGRARGLRGSSTAGTPPAVSVIIPAYNGARFLRESIDSALGQSWTDREVLVVDDGSTDETPSIIASYGDRIRSIRQPNRGAAAALNAGIRATSGTWVAWLSQDDTWEPTKLARQMAWSQEHPSAGLIYTDYWRVDEAGRAMGERRAACPATRRGQMLRLVWDCYINANSAIIRREVLDRVGPLDEAERWGFDVELFFRIVASFEIARVPELLVRYRIHAAQETQQVHASEWAVARGIRRMGPVTGAIGLAIYLGFKAVRLPLNVRKASHREKTSLRSVLRSFPGFVLLVAKSG